MNYFMVSVTLPEIDDEFICLLPEQRTYIEKLIENGMVSSYSLACDRSQLWVVFSVDDTNQVRGLLSCFPIIDKVTYDIIPLIFHQDSTEKIQSFSLN